jgi:ankyrin repeat protein
MAYADITKSIDFRFWHDAVSGHVEGAKDLLANGANVNYMFNGDAALKSVAISGNLEMIQVLISAGADINSLGSSGRTPLGNVAFHPFISEKKRIQITKVLLNFGASPNIWHPKRESPLIEATQRKNFEVVKLLLTHGANVNDLSSQKATPLDSASDSKIIKLLLKMGGEIGGYYVNTQTRIKENEVHSETQYIKLSPQDHKLFMSIYKNDLKEFELAIQNGANVNAIKNNNVTPISVAVKIPERTEFIKRLIDYGANIFTGPRVGYNDLELAVLHNNIKAVKILLQDEKVKIQNQKDSPLKLAKNPKIAKILIKEGANVQRAIEYVCNGIHEISPVILKVLLEEGANPDPQNCSILYNNLNNYSVVQLLLRHGANPNAIDNGSRTIYEPVLLKAADKDNKEIIQALLSHGAEVNIRDTNGNTALMNASNLGNGKAVQTLINNGANVNLKNRFGNSALLMVSTIEIADMLIEAGANALDILPRFWKTPLSTPLEKELFLIVAKNDFDKLKKLNAEKLLTKDPEAQGQLLLNLAITFGRINMVEWLLDHGANANTGNANGIKPLHLAVLMPTLKPEKQIKVIKLLLNKQANINDNSYPGGYSAVHLAVIQDNSKVTEFLLNSGADFLAGHSNYRDVLRPNATVDDTHQLFTIYFRPEQGDTLKIKIMLRKKYGTAK